MICENLSPALAAAYKSRLATLQDELDAVQSGDVLCTSGVLCEPIGFLSHFHTIVPRLENVELIKGRNIDYDFLAMPQLKDHVQVIGHLFDGALRQANALGAATHIPSNLHDFMDRRTAYKPIDKFIAMATPMDKNGNFVVSGCGMWEESAYRSAKTVILEVNPHLPRFKGCLTIPLEKVDMIVEVDYPATEYPIPPSTEIDKKIGGYVASFVHDYDCIQLGLGGMPNAVGNAFFDKKGLGLHTELYTPVIGELIRAGVITGEAKTIDRGQHVGTFVQGDNRLYDVLSTDPGVCFKPVTYTNDPFVISQIDNMVSINTALEIDLTGQICSESIGPRQYSGTGGASDFAYGALHSKGGRGIIAMASTAKGGAVSKIKATLTPGSVVSISRNLADIIVTEYGVAYLRGRTVRERAEALIAIAHPDFRADLRQQARELFYL